MSYLRSAASVALGFSLLSMAGVSAAVADESDAVHVNHLGGDSFTIAQRFHPGYTKVYLVDKSDVSASVNVGLYQDAPKIIVDSKDPQWSQTSPLSEVVAASKKATKFPEVKITGSVPQDTVSVNDAVFGGKQPTGDVYVTATPIDTLLTQANIKGSPIIQMNSDGTIPKNSYTGSAINLYCVGAACNARSVVALNPKVIQGATRYSTAIELAKHAHPQGFTKAYLVSGNDQATLLQATSATTDPVLLYNPAVQDPQVKAVTSKLTNLVTLGSEKRFADSKVKTWASDKVPDSAVKKPTLSNQEGITLQVPSGGDFSNGGDIYSIHKDGWAYDASMTINSSGEAVVMYCGSSQTGACSQADVSWIKSKLKDLGIKLAYYAGQQGV